MSVPVAVLMCHAPIVVPEIGATRAGSCHTTTRAMRAAAVRIVRSRPDVLVVISPHAPRDRSRWGIADAAELSGDFSQFGAPDVLVRLPGAPAAAHALARVADREGVPTYHPSLTPLDHGALVPLYFMIEAGWRGPTLVLALPAFPYHDEEAMGHAIARAAASHRWAVIASGDMSHRLEPGAPAGFHPRAREFDRQFAQRLAAGDLRGACHVDGELRDLAAEDVIETTRVAAAAVMWNTTGHETLAYERPFGVGYLEAVLYDESLVYAALPDELRDLPNVARAAILAAMMQAPLSCWSERKAQGVFVTLRRAGVLRGSVGSVEARARTLELEVARHAVRAALRDPRFRPLTIDEVDDTHIEVNVLDPLERVNSLSELDPTCYGIVVTSGSRRGVMLPNLDGIESADEQVRIAMRKGGIDPTEPVTVDRFTVRKIIER